jgi:hypothetical protein
VIHSLDIAKTPSVDIFPFQLRVNEQAIERYGVLAGRLVTPNEGKNLLEGICQLRKGDDDAPTNANSCQMAQPAMAPLEATARRTPNAVTRLVSRSR